MRNCIFFLEPDTIQLNIPFLSTVSESTLSTSELLNDDKKADILIQLCYGMSRQWIGASATMSEWNEEWVQRALATFLRTDCVNEVRLLLQN